MRRRRYLTTESLTTCCQIKAPKGLNRAQPDRIEILIKGVTMREKVNIGVIGAGRIGRMHAENLAFRIPDAHVPAISDIIPEAAKGCAAACNIPKAHDDYRRILDDPEVDAILICSSTDTHTRFIVEAARAGKHIFCEKHSNIVCTYCNTITNYNSFSFNGNEPGIIEPYKTKCHNCNFIIHYTLKRCSSLHILNDEVELVNTEVLINSSIA